MELNWTRTYFILGMFGSCKVYIRNLREVEGKNQKDGKDGNYWTIGCSVLKDSYIIKKYTILKNMFEIILLFISFKICS